MSFIDTFLNALEPFRQVVVIHPLTVEEVEQIERVLGGRLPGYYREFLLKIGLKQDVVLGLHDQFRDFDNLDNLLPENEGHRFFRFGHNGGEEYWLLRIDDPSDMTIYEYDQYSSYRIVSMRKTFERLLQEAVEHLKLNKTRLIENHFKAWRVQFAVDTFHAHDVVEALGTWFDCVLVSAPSDLEVTAAGVICSEGHIMIDDVIVQLRKQEFRDWNSPSYYFNWEEPVEEMIRDSKIKRMEAALVAGGLDVTVIDYGITVRK